MYSMYSVQEYYKEIKEKYHEMNMMVVDKIISRIQKKNHYRVIDIGCGLAPLCDILINKLDNISKGCVVEYYGIDNCKEMIDLCKTMYTPNKKTKLIFEEKTIEKLMKKEDQIYYDIVICQSFIHLILEDRALERFKSFLNHIIAPDGVCYVSTRTNVNVIRYDENGIYFVEKSPGVEYRRVTYNMPSLSLKFLNYFENINYYDISLEKYYGMDNKNFLLVFLKKDLVRHNMFLPVDIGMLDYDIGYTHDMINTKKPRAYTENLDTMDICRYEGLLMTDDPVNDTVFSNVMIDISEKLEKYIGDKQLIYIKDKYVMNYKGKKFPVHKDNEAEWKKRLDDSRIEKFITIGIFPDEIPIVDYEKYGPTRLIKPYNDKYHNWNISMVGQRNMYYVFDDNVVHDSGLNTQDRTRDIFFITFAVIENPKTHIGFRHISTDMSLAKKFYDEKKSLTVEEIRKIKDDETQGNFYIDKFGKIIFREKILNN